MTFAKIGRAAEKRGYSFIYLLSQADVEGLHEIGLADELTSEKSGATSSNNSSRIITYPGAFNRSECLDLAAQYSELSPIEVAMLFVNVGTRSCDNLLSNDFIWQNVLLLEQFVFYFGDLGWPCSSLVADRIDQTRTALQTDYNDQTSVRSASLLPRIMFQGNIAIDPWCEYYGVPSPATEIPQLMGTARWFLAGHEQHPIALPKRLVNVLLREISRQVVRWVVLRPYTKLRQKAQILPHDIYDSVESMQALVVFPVVWGVEPPRALPPNWKAVHPILPSKAKPVTGSIAAFIESSCHDKILIVVSFGTQASLSMEQVVKIFDAVTSLPDFCFVWRLPARNAQPSNSDQKRSNNVLIVEWLPQNNLLGHPKAYAFVSHVGYGSLYEAAYHGKPIVGIPIFGDQEDNIHRAVVGGWGIRLDKDQFTSRDLVDGIQQAAGDPMRQRAREISVLVEARSGVEEVIDWMDYARAYGVNHLMPYRTIRSSYRARYNLDASLVLVGLNLGAVLLLYRFAKKRQNNKTNVTIEKEKAA